MASPNGEPVVVPTNAQALANYPHARRVGDFIYVSGISSRRLDNSYAGVTTNADGTVTLDIAEQTRAVIENIGIVLKAAGASLANIVDVTVFLTDMADYKGMNAVYNEFFDAQTGPARTTVGVKQLPNPNLLVEIKSCAYMPRQ